MNERIVPIVAITTGYGLGVGPEVVAKTLARPIESLPCRPIVVGDGRILQEITRICGIRIEWNKIKDAEQAEFRSDRIDLIDMQAASTDELKWGTIVASVGRASGDYVTVAAKAALSKKVDGVVLGPLNKEALSKGGYTHSDELELLSSAFETQKPSIVSVWGNVWMTSVTGHIPFREIHKNINTDNVLRRIRILNDAMHQSGVEDPRIAVAALNVHGGEDGLFGDEEDMVIKPAIIEAKKLGIKAYGPFPSDSMVIRVEKEGYNAIVKMYHDQINVGGVQRGNRILPGAVLYIGLPVPCGTSGHGTAFDLAGKGIADPSSMQATVDWVSRLARATHK